VAVREQSKPKNELSGLVTVRVVQTPKTNRCVRFRGWWLSGNVQNPENKHEHLFLGLVVVSSTSVYRNLGQPCPLSSLTTLVMCNGSSLRLAFRAREWLVVARKGVKPVCLAFRVREGWVVGGMKPLRLVFRAREGFAVGRPSITRNASERGWDGWETPPSRVSSEGGLTQFSPNLLDLGFIFKATCCKKLQTNNYNQYKLLLNQECPRPV